MRLPRSPPSLALMWLGGWRSGGGSRGLDIGDPSAHGTGSIRTFFLIFLQRIRVPYRNVGGGYSTLKRYASLIEATGTRRFFFLAHPPAPYSPVAQIGESFLALWFQLRLAASGCLLGGATWRPACCNAGIPANHIESRDQIRGVLG